MSDTGHPALGPQFPLYQPIPEPLHKASTQPPPRKKPAMSAAQHYQATMDYRYSTNPDRPTDERHEKRRDR